jgi:tungstate transport system permease protein
MNNPILEALRILFSGDSEVLFIVFTSLKFSIASVLITSVFSIPLGISLHLKSFRFKKGIVAFLHGLMALPTVVIGLLVYALFSNSGLFSGSRILFTPVAIIIGQSILAFPLITSMVYSGLSKLDPRFKETLITLGARKKDIFKATIRESRFIILSAVLAGFGRVVGEVGVSMMLGGNIRWFTRTITTTIALETSKGAFSLALALGIILMIIALGINFLLHLLVNDE